MYTHSVHDVHTVFSVIFPKRNFGFKNESLPTERPHKKRQIKIQKEIFFKKSIKNEVKKNEPKEVKKKEIKKKAKETKKW